jgi:haloalkane dehalogenase
MKILSTPVSQFENIQDFPFVPNFCEVEKGLNMHFVDEGKGPIVLLLHGEPSWSYLYRKMIPILVAAGYRVIAPDLIGFGKSDKPINKEAYSFKSHLSWLQTLLSKLQLKDIHLFCQDWGGLLGLRTVGDDENLFSSITVSNTFLPLTGIPANEAFKKWRHFSQVSPEFSAAAVLQMGTVSELSKEVLAAYDAPFPTEEYKAGARIFPTLVPFDGEDPYNEIPNCDKAWKVLEKWEKPFLTLFGDSDPIMRGGDMFFQMKVPGAKGQAHAIIKDGGHFIQEEKGEELAGHLLAFLRSQNV